MTWKVQTLANSLAGYSLAWQHCSGVFKAPAACFLNCYSTVVPTGSGTCSFSACLEQHTFQTSGRIRAAKDTLEVVITTQFSPYKEGASGWKKIAEVIPPSGIVRVSGSTTISAQQRMT